MVYRITDLWFQAGLEPLVGGTASLIHIFPIIITSIARRNISLGKGISFPALDTALEAMKYLIQHSPPIDRASDGGNVLRVASKFIGSRGFQRVPDTI